MKRKHGSLWNNIKLIEIWHSFTFPTQKWEWHLEKSDHVTNPVLCCMLYLVAQLCLTLCNPMNSSMPGLPVHHQLPGSTQTQVHWIGDAIQPSHPLSSPYPPALNLSQHQGLFKWVSSSLMTLAIRWPKYWSFSFNISPSNEYPGLISFRTDWLDLFAVQGTRKSLLQHHHSSKASILWHSAFFIVQLSHPFMTTGKKHRLD